MSEIDALAQEIHELRAEQRQTRDAVLTLQAGLDQRCPNNERRIGDVERRLRNGNGGAGISVKALLAALAAITVLAGALATVATRALGVP